MANADQFQVLAQLRQPVWIYDVERCRVHWANGAGLAIWQAADLGELTSRDLAADMSPEIATRLAQYHADFQAKADASFNEIWTLYPNGQPYTLHMIMTAFPLDDGRMAMMVEGLQHHALDADGLRSLEALSHTPVMVTLFDEAGSALYRNPAARAALESGPEGLREHFLVEADYRSTTLALKSTGVANITAQVHAFGETRWHDIAARRCHDAITGNTAWLVSEVDVTGLKSAQHHAQFLANHDSLTQLPNRNYVNERFGERLEEVRARGEEGALVFIDLDHFKNVNDSLGHAAGDELLVETAERLRRVVCQSDLIARLGGDEFLILTSAPHIERQVKGLAARISRALRAPVVLDGREVRVTPTLGASLFPKDGDDVQTLMRHADLAVYEAKAQGRDKLVRYTPALGAAVRARITLERDIRQAFERNEFDVYYQPRVRVSDGVPCAVEALARWHHPSQGLVGPDAFITMCESMGCIDQLGRLVLERAVRAQAEWRAEGHDLDISVNLSPLQMRGSNLVSELLEVVHDADGDPRSIMLEITESVLLGQDRETTLLIERLSEAGFRIAIDDFGTGYSNLAYLHRYPLDCLKIDRSFISGLDTAQAVTELIVSMAKLLEMDIIAEGVQTTEQLRWVCERGCLEYQGYLFSPPLPKDGVSAMLDAHRAPVSRAAQGVD